MRRCFLLVCGEEGGRGGSGVPRRVRQRRGPEVWSQISLFVPHSAGAHFVLSSLSGSSGGIVAMDHPKCSFGSFVRALGRNLSRGGGRSTQKILRTHQNLEHNQQIHKNEAHTKTRCTQQQPKERNTQQMDWSNLAKNTDTPMLAKIRSKYDNTKSGRIRSGQIRP